MRPLTLVTLAVPLALLSLAAIPTHGAAPAVPPTAAPWEGEAFAASPATIAKAAAAAKGEEGDTVVVLYSEAEYDYDAANREVYRSRLIYKILDKSADESWATVEESWEPWHQERPEIRARVVTPDGASHALDPSTLTENSSASSSPDMFEDGKVLRAPLPAILPGSVVEVDIVTRDKTPFFDGGMVRYHGLEVGAPVEHARLILQAPAGLPLRFKQRLAEAKPVEEVRSGVRRVTFDYFDIEPSDDPEPGLPSDAPRLAYVAFSTGPSWSDLARRYSAIVDRALTGSDLAPWIRSLSAPPAGGDPSQIETIARVLRKLAAEVRYTGVELGEGSLVPRPPAETLRRKFGDCKDKAVLLSAVLRDLDIPAYVALLNAGEDEQDIEPELPGMGNFNHAIVVVPGNPALWIDPTDPYARPGELPAADQGRLALIASPGTTGLVRTPESTSAENREIETREFRLADLGKGAAVESDEYWGEPERALRSAYSTQDPKSIRQGLESYGTAAFNAVKVKAIAPSDPADLSGPFQLRLELEGVGLAATDLADAVVAVQPGVLLHRLPEEFFGAESSDTDKGEAGASRKRVADYVFAQPATYELRYRIVPPAGFAPRLERKNQVRALGPATLAEEYGTGADGTVTAVLRLDTGKRRYSPQEFQSLKGQVAEVLKEKPIILHFEQVGEAHLAAGRIPEALAEFRRLAEAAPLKALPHLRIARTLLAGGLGEAAREEVRLAAQLEPKLAMAQRDLGWVLQHDDVGRRFGPGFDRAGAIAAYRRAIELDPKDATARGDLAILYEHDAKGRRYFPGANLAEAIAAYQALGKDLDVHGMDGNLLVALFRAERFPEVIELAKKVEPGASVSGLLVAAIAATQGVPDAMREAEQQAKDAGGRSEVLTGAAQNLVSIRRYPEAAELLEGASRRSETAANLLARAEVLRKTHRRAAGPLPGDVPVDVVKQLLSTLADPQPNRAAAVSALLSQGANRRLAAEKGLEPWVRQETEGFEETLTPDGMPFGASLDFIDSAFRFTTTGDDASGYRVTMQSATAAEGALLNVYLVREGAGYKVAALGGAPDMIGSEILRQLDRGDLAGARRWLGWAAEGLTPPPETREEDPVPAVPFLALWKRGETLDGDSLRCAAATLLPFGTGSARDALPLLDSCRSKGPEAWHGPLDMTLAAAYITLDRPEDTLKVAERLSSGAPTSLRAFGTQIAALVRLKRWSDLRALAQKRLDGEPGDTAALRALAQADFAQGGLEAGKKHLQEIVAGSKGQAGDYNELAWLSLFLGPVDDQALEYGKRASTLSGYSSPASLHTLASLYAEQNKPAEAYRLIVQSLNVGRMTEPNGDDWYVFGRLAELYGMPAAARGFYQRTLKGAEEGPLSTRELAQKRLETLGPAPLPVAAKAAAKKVAR